LEIGEARDHSFEFVLALSSTPFPNFWIYGSGSGVDLIAPSMDHRVASQAFVSLEMCAE
jgi:hypothetical protein